MQGAYVELRKLQGRSVENYIIAARILQGNEDLGSSTLEERRDILARWNNFKFDNKGFYALKLKEARGEKGKAAGTPTSPEEENGNALQPPQTGWRHTRHLSFDERKELHRRKETWKKGHVEARIPVPSSGSTTTLSTVGSRELEEQRQIDEEFERAIQASVRETSRGNVDEDRMVEEAIRANVLEMRRQGHDIPDPPVPRGVMEAAQGQGASQVDLEITDEEYQALIEKAIQQSVVLHAAGLTQGTDHPEDDHEQDEELRRAIELSKSEAAHPSSSPASEDEDLKKAIDESKAAPPVPPRSAAAGQEAEEEQLRRAIEQSEAEAKEAEQRNQEAMTEEEIVLEYVKKQSLAEEEFRRQRQKGKGTGEGDDEEADEEMRRAVEESLRLSYGDGAGPSGSGRC
jgi:hypothetical protein